MGDATDGDVGIERVEVSSDADGAADLLEKRSLLKPLEFCISGLLRLLNNRPNVARTEHEALLSDAVDAALCRIGQLCVCVMLFEAVLSLWRVNCSTADVRSGWISPLRRGTSPRREASCMLPGGKRSSCCKLCSTAVRGSGELARR